MSYQARNLLVTGGAGFIGANYVRWLLKTNPSVNVVNLDMLTYAGSLSNLQSLPGADRHLFVQGDINDSVLVDHLLRKHNIDTIVHFAAESHVDRSISGPGEFVRTNINGTHILLEAARQYWINEQRLDRATLVAARRFHHISTDEVFGSLGPNDPEFTEETPYAPNSPYSASKAASDHLVRAYHHTYGLPVTTSNCSNNYGPLQHGEKFIPTVIRNALAGSPIPVYGDGSNIRDWLYVEDHACGIQRVIEQGQVGQTYNIGGHNEWRNIDIVRLILSLIDQRQPQAEPRDKLISFVTDRPGHDWRYAIDASKMKNELGWIPAETFETGLAKTLDFYLASESSGARHV